MARPSTLFLWMDGESCGCFFLLNVDFFLLDVWSADSSTRCGYFMWSGGERRWRWIKSENCLARKKKSLSNSELYIRFFLIAFESYHKDFAYLLFFICIHWLFIFCIPLVPFHPSQPLTWEVEYHVLFAVSRSHLSSLAIFTVCCALLKSSPRVGTQFSGSQASSLRLHEVHREFYFT